MKKVFLPAALCFATASCTLDKTDYLAEISTVVTEHNEFKEVAVIRSDDYTITLSALNGTLYKGYNEIRLKVTNSRTGGKENVSGVTFLPVTNTADGGQTSCPHRYDLAYIPDENYFSGYAVFTRESSATENWELYINFTINGQVHTVKQPVSVQQQTNKNLNMITFTGNDEGQYIIALVSPQKPKVAENELVAGIYRSVSPPAQPTGNFAELLQETFTEVSGYTLQLDPRMPEPSMGNHSSPNNRDLTRGEDGLYHGVVNYTMTGNWTLNFILLNPNGKIVKGTKVPLDFTPGVEGKKSELYIDILF